ncbi:hypothetical protein BN946_scf185011.g23 [Trametes cinnabarina]|uniref:DUF6534 domain-containing protein n=1 Tax=Pycnoporus cinnabarinus TaxID=5643 RepID=A0A060SVY6_PYCCI|nr:hypothetical protein BN946_scf185011.g23 [Trametes cinnabarina]
MVLVDDVIGALLIEVCLACILYGVTTLQTFLYYQTFSEDSRFLKGMVGAVWVMETLHTALCMELVYTYSVTHFGDYDFLGNIYWGAGASILVGVRYLLPSAPNQIQAKLFIKVFISAAVHAFYIRRVWIMSSGSIPVTAFISVLALCRFGCGVGSFILSLKITEWAPFRINVSPLVTIALGLGCASAVDVLVALTLSYYIQRGRGKWESGTQESDSRIDTVLIYAVNTGAITAISSVLSVILFATQKKSLVFLGLVEIQSKLYANSFLGSLNVRAAHRNTPSSATYEFTPRRAPVIRPPQFRTPGDAEFTVPRVAVHQQTVVMRDNGEVDVSSLRFKDTYSEFGENSDKGELV